MGKIGRHPFIWALLGITLVVSGALYGVRASSYLEQTLRRHLENVEAQKDIELDFRTLEPAGLTGIELKGVTGQLRFDGRRVSMRFDSLRLYVGYNPFESLNTVALNATVASNGSFDISPAKSKPEHKAPSDQQRSFASKENENPGDSEIRRDLWSSVDFGLSGDLEVIFRETTIEWESNFAQFRPLAIDRLVMTRGDFDVSGYGHLPDKTAFSVSSTSHTPKAYVIKTHDRMRLDKWLPAIERQLVRQMLSAAINEISIRNNTADRIDAEVFFEHIPLEVEPFELKLCPRCETPSARTEKLNISSRTEDSHIGSVSISFGETFSVDLADVTLPVLPSGTRLEGTTLHYLPTDRNVAVDIRLSQTESCEMSETVGSPVKREPICSTSPWLSDESEPLAEETLEVGLEVDSSNWDIQGQLRSNRFRLQGFWQRLGLDAYLRYGRVSGTQLFSYSWRDGQITGDMQLETHDIDFRLPIVSRDWLRLEHAAWTNEYAVDLTGGQARLHDGVFAVSRNDFVDYNLLFGWTGGSPRLKARARTGWLNPNSLKRSLPGPISSVTAQTAFDGLFGVTANILVDADDPNQTVLDVEAFGDVDTIARKSSFKIWSLASNGPPSFEISAEHVDWIESSEWTPIQDIPDRGIETLIAGEDTTFFEHHGFNWDGLRGAIVANLKQSELHRGGSTLTQQLAKNLFLTSERTLSRKLKEAYYTWRLEEWLSKDRILELYLNIVQFGPGIVGIEAAGHYYFGESLDEMDWLDYILLTSILPAPNFFGHMLRKDQLPHSRVTKAKHILKNLHFEDKITTDKYQRLLERVRDLPKTSKNRQIGRSTATSP